MKLQSTDRWSIGGVILAWALIPLVGFLLVPAAGIAVVGPVMLIGLLLAGVAIFVVLWRAARREEAACDTRMAAMGFAKERVQPERVRGFVPAELREDPACLDGFEIPGAAAGTKEIYLRERGDLRTMLYGLWVGSGRSRSYHVVACLECRTWVWPAFSLSPSDWPENHLTGWMKITLPEDPEFYRRWQLLATDERGVRQLFTPGARSSLNRLGETRLSASESRLFLYARNRLLLDGRAAEWLESAALLAGGLSPQSSPHPAFAAAVGE